MIQLLPIKLQNESTRQALLLFYIQAVGWARTLRTEAIVELYSNFPLRVTNQFVWNSSNTKRGYNIFTLFYLVINILLF